MYEIIRYILRRILIKSINMAKLIKLHFLSFQHAFSLTLQQDNLHKIMPDHIILFSVMKNESIRLPFFLDYYRKLGVDHFILVDNGSTDNFYQSVKEQQDVTFYNTESSYKDANYGVYWLNYLLSKQGSNHWCMTCDPDEFFVYPYMDSRNLQELTHYLDSNRASSFFTMMVDMYSQSSIDDTVYSAGQNPLDLCPYFDKEGYEKKYSPRFTATLVTGGVRRRVFFSDEPKNSPALHKLPLIKWKRHYAYLLSTHIALPEYLNDATQTYDTTGALLHFKFINSLSIKVDEEMTARQHWNNSYEYKKYDTVLKNKTLLFNENLSIRYKGWKTLTNLDLIQAGDW